MSVTVVASKVLPDSFEIPERTYVMPVAPTLKISVLLAIIERFKGSFSTEIFKDAIDAPSSIPPATWLHEMNAKASKTDRSKFVNFLKVIRPSKF